MRITFYDTIIKNYQTILVKEKAVNYKADRINSPRYAVELINNLTSLNIMAEEHCYMLALNYKNRLLGVFLVSKGIGNQTLVSPREIYMRALLIGASYIVLYHNHPSQEVIPSNADFEITKKVKDAGELLGIPLADHIIIGGIDYYSFKEHGQL